MEVFTRKCMLSVLALLFITMSYAQENPDKIHKTVDQVPEYKGGFDKMVAVLVEEMKYPKSASKEGISGKVFVEFVVEKNGSLSNIKTLKSVDPVLDKEAERVVAKLDGFSPGEHQGKKVRVRMVLPIDFALGDEESKD
jgi:protein TonB